MKKTILILIIGLLLGGCVYDVSKNDNSNLVITNPLETEKVAPKNNFEKKQECSKYISKVEKEVEDIKNSTGNFPTKPEVYYSPELDTCISTYTIHNDSPGNRFRAFIINDLLINKQIYFRGYEEEGLKELSKEGKTGFEEFEQKKEELIK